MDGTHEPASTEAKPILAVDCDGVLADLGNYLLGKINAQLGTKYTEADCHTYFYRECLGAEAGALADTLINADDWYAHPLPFPQAAQELARLHPYYEIHIVTHMARSAYAVRQAWLATHGFGPVQLHDASGALVKVEIAKSLGAVAFIEDRLDVAQALAQAGIETYLIDRPWNQSAEMPEGIIRTNFTGAIEALLEKRS